VHRSNAAADVQLKGDIQVMADTGEKRPIIGRANAKEAETIRTEKKMVSEERSTAKASDAAFGGTGQGSRRHTKKSKQRNPDPEVSKDVSGANTGHPS
jgi:hypothetical protein